MPGGIDYPDEVADPEGPEIVQGPGAVDGGVDVAGDQGHTGLAGSGRVLLDGAVAVVHGSVPPAHGVDVGGDGQGCGFWGSDGPCGDQRGSQAEVGYEQERA